MHSLVLVLLILVCRVQTGGLYFAAIRQCSNNSTDFYIAKGQPLMLCCYLTEGKCSNTTDKDSLNLVPQAGAKIHLLKKTRMSRVNTCTAMYKVERADVPDSGKYICYKNNDSSPPLMLEEVYVLDKPEKPKDIKVIYFESNSTLAVTFNKGEVSGEWYNEYRVTLDYGNSYKVLCNLTCPQNSTLCTCYYQEKKGLLSDNVILTVNASRPNLENPIRSSSKSVNLNLYRHIRPSSVMNLSVLSHNSFVAVIQFQLSGETKTNIQSMHLSGRPFRFKINLRTADSSQNIFLQLTKSIKTVYWLSEGPEQNVAVIFQDLAPNTKYTVSVFGVGGGGEGDVNSRKFTTKKSVPVHPPVVHPSTFSVWPYSNGTCCLLLLWKSLGGIQKGGDRLEYKAQVIGPDDKQVVVVNTTETYLNEKLSWLPRSINIWAVNEVGESHSYSQIIIPETARNRDVTTHINIDRAKAEVSLLYHTNQLVQSLAIHWCDSEKSQVCKTVDICKGSLHTQHFNVTDTGQIHSFNISLVVACKKFTSETKRKVTYIDFESLGNHTVEGTTEASVIETEYRLVRPDNEETGETCTDTEYIRESVGPKAFFASIKDKENRWTGMMPAKCYYYNDASTVDIEINPTFDSDKEVILSIQQRCDGPESKTKQFLVKKYEIYSSVNNTCTTIEKLTELENDLFTSINYQLPPGVMHVCVKASGQESSFIVAKSIEFPRVTEKDQTIVISVFVGVLAFVFIMAAFIYFFKKCQDRENHFKKLWRLNSFASLSYSSYHVIKNCNVGKDPENITNDSGLESCVNTDSKTNGSIFIKAGRTEPICQSLKGSINKSTDSGCPLDFSQTPPNKQFLMKEMSDRQFENSPFLKDCADSSLGGKSLASAGSRLGGGSGSAKESDSCSHEGSSQERANNSHSFGTQESANSSHSGSTQESDNISSSGETSESEDNSHSSDIEERQVSSGNYGLTDRGINFVPPD